MYPSALIRAGQSPKSVPRRGAVDAAAIVSHRIASQRSALYRHLHGFTRLTNLTIPPAAALYGIAD
eukprot:1846026-Pleurochrysis_carterae.AAC.1